MIWKRGPKLKEWSTDEKNSNWLRSEEFFSLRGELGRMERDGVLHHRRQEVTLDPLVIS